MRTSEKSRQSEMQRKVPSVRFCRDMARPPCVLIRAAVLFAVGVLLALLLQAFWPPNVLGLHTTGPLRAGPNTWWLFPVCGVAAAVIGLLCPCIDSRIGGPSLARQEWTMVLRCLAVFVGIIHAGAKIEFGSEERLALTLAVLSLGLWWAYDGSWGGLGVGLGNAGSAVLVAHLLLYNSTMPSPSDLLFARSWLPSTFFAGGVTVGNIGRQLALYDWQGAPVKIHTS
uniref:Insulin-induced gene 2 protein n=1 Tax=Eptatretus burgeri TaxID=7764 RepID=A0A8C4Q6W2_EPTBU